MTDVPFGIKQGADGRVTFIVNDKDIPLSDDEALLLRDVLAMSDDPGMRQIGHLIDEHLSSKPASSHT